MEKTESKKHVASRMTTRLIIRVSDEDAKKVEENARLCGLTRSAYLRKIIAGKTPKMRMTEKERAAFASFQDARGDIVRLFNFLKSRPAPMRSKIMNSITFIKKWIKAAQKILTRMVEVEKSFTE